MSAPIVASERARLIRSTVGDAGYTYTYECK